MSPILKAKDLSILFGGLKALSEVTFDVYQGEILSIIGPNGAGKTTLLNVLTGFLKSSHGSIYYKDEEITELKPYSIASKGLLRTFQQNSLFLNLTVFQNVLTGFHCKMKKSSFINSILKTNAFKKEEEDFKYRVYEILKTLNMEDQASSLAANLPYGDQRKLGIAIALAANPNILMLDEPVCGMNPDESKRMMNTIKELREYGITILLVEHDMQVVMGISDRIIVLNQGDKIAEGTPSEISQNAVVVSVYLGDRSFAQP